MHACTFSTFLSTIRSMGPQAVAWFVVGMILGCLIVKCMMKK
jgi:hypothetical protein